MNLATRSDIRKALPQLVRLMGLKHWDITVSETPAGEEYDAFMRWIPGTYSASLHLGPDWSEKDEWEHLHTVFHELVHLHLADSCDAISKDLPELMGKPMFLAFWPQWERSLEHAVDAIGKAWAGCVKSDLCS